MEPKSTAPAPPPVMGAPVAYPAPPAAAAYAAGPYAHAPAAALYSPPPPPPPPSNSAAAQQGAAAAQQQQQLQMQIFWMEQQREIDATVDFKNHNLPLARIKKIMKADEDVRMIAAEAPVVFARACEMFILELTHRGWAHAEENKRRTLQKSDIAAAVGRNEVFDFLVDIVPRDEPKDAEAAAAAAGGMGPAGIPHPVAGMPATDSMGYYYVQPQ